LKTAVVILNYNGEKLLRQFLPSVVTYSAGAHIVVADNGSSDGSIEFMEREYPAVSIIKLDNNYGFCGGYNRALRQVEADYYVLLNSDIEVTPGWLEPLEALLDSYPSIAAVQPKILSWHQKDSFEYAGAAGGFIDALGYPYCRGRLFTYLEKDTGQYNDEIEIFWATGACLMIRSKTYHSLGGLDEDFFAHMEEIDLCWRIQRSGNQVFYCGKSHVYHVGAGTLSRSNPKKTYYNFRNGLSLLFKNLSTVNLIIRLPIRLMLDFVAVAISVLPNSPYEAKPILQAHVDFFKSWKQNTLKRQQLRKTLPYTMKNIYKGLIVFEYFKKKLRH
jgi:hypothetical protein